MLIGFYREFCWANWHFPLCNIVGPANRSYTAP